MAGKASLLSRFKYWFDSTVARGTFTMVVWLGIISIIILFIFAIILIAINPSNHFPSSNFPEIFWRTFLISMDPGVIAEESEWLPRLIFLIVIFFGLFVVSTLIGVVGSGVQDKIMDLRRGRSIVLEKSHTVILGWSHKIDIIIGELMLANEEHPSFTVSILAPRDKIFMESYLEPRLGKNCMKKVHCRSGEPSIIQDLSIVSPQFAKSILILCYDKEKSDFMILKRTLALKQVLGDSHEIPPVVAEVMEKNNSFAINSTGNLFLVAPTEFITRVLVQAAREPGLSMIYEEIFSFVGNEIYAYANPIINGLSISELAVQMPNSALIGFIDKNGEIKLNCDYDHKIEAGEQILVIAEDDSLILPPKDSFLKWPKLEKTKQNITQQDKPLIIYVFGWHDAGKIFLEEIGSQIHPDSSIHLFFDSKYVDLSIQQPREIDIQVNFSVREEDTVSYDFLTSLDWETVDEVVVLGYRINIDAQDADGLTLLTLIHLRNISQKFGCRFGIASELIDPNNRDLAKCNNSEDFIASEELVSRVMAQILEKPELKSIFDQILTGDGAEFHLRQSSKYGENLNNIEFGSLVEAGLEQDELVVGLLLSDTKTDRPKLILNPTKEFNFSLRSNDRVVVLAEE